MHGLSGAEAVENFEAETEFVGINDSTGVVSSYINIDIKISQAVFQGHVFVCPEESIL